MTRRVRVSFLIPALAVALVTAPTTYSAAGSSDARHPSHRSFKERLGLTDDQVKAIREVHERQADTRKQLWQTLHQARVELRQLALNGGDEAAITAKTAEVSQLLAQLVEMRVTTLREIAPILTPEQREALAKMNFHGRWHRQARDENQS